MTDDPVSPRWHHWRDTVDLDEYHARWARMEASGTASHGEADLIEGYGLGSVLDAGCGMGRVAIELHHRGMEVAGVDLDADLLAYARVDAPQIPWHHADLTDMQLGRTFPLVAMPGNVMIFCRDDHRGPIVANLAGHRVLATMWWAEGDALAPARRQALLDSAREVLAAGPLHRTAGATAAQPRVVVVRLLTHGVEPVLHCLMAVRAAWRRQAWALAPNPPRIWRF